MHNDHKDELLLCALKLAELKGSPTSPNSLLSGIYVHQGKIELNAFPKVLERIHYDAVQCTLPFTELFKEKKTLILCLKDEHYALIYEDRDADHSDASAVEGYLFFQTNHRIPITYAYLEQHYTGSCFIIKETPPLIDVDNGKALQSPDHWLFGTLWHFRKIYYQVGLATVLTNLLAIVTPLFSLNVYDRVIPNASFPTLWVLAIGVIFAFAFDFLFKLMKGYFVDRASKTADQMLSHQLIEKVLSLPVSQQNLSVGSFIQHTKELETIREFFSSSTFVSFIDLPFGLFILAIIGCIGGFWLFLLD